MVDELDAEAVGLVAADGLDEIGEKLLDVDVGDVEAGGVEAGGVEAGVLVSVVDVGEVLV